MFCTKCGSQQADTSNFCKNRGNPLHKPVTPVTQTITLPSDYPEFVKDTYDVTKVYFSSDAPTKVIEGLSDKIGPSRLKGRAVQPNVQNYEPAMHYLMTFMVELQMNQATIGNDKVKIEQYLSNLNQHISSLPNYSQVSLKAISIAIANLCTMEMLDASQGKFLYETIIYMKEYLQDPKSAYVRIVIALYLLIARSYVPSGKDIEIISLVEEGLFNRPLNTLVIRTFNSIFNLFRTKQDLSEDVVNELNRVNLKYRKSSLKIFTQLIEGRQKLYQVRTQIRMNPNMGNIFQSQENDILSSIQGLVNSIIVAGDDEEVSQVTIQIFELYLQFAEILNLMDDPMVSKMQQSIKFVKQMKDNPEIVLHFAKFTSDTTDQHTIDQQYFFDSIASFLKSNNEPQTLQSDPILMKIRNPAFLYSAPMFDANFLNIAKQQGITFPQMMEMNKQHLTSASVDEIELYSFGTAWYSRNGSDFAYNQAAFSLTNDILNLGNLSGRAQLGVAYCLYFVNQLPGIDNEVLFNSARKLIASYPENEVVKKMMNGVIHTLEYKTFLQHELQNQIKEYRLKAADSGQIR